MADGPELEMKILDAISQVLREGNEGFMVTKFVAIVEGIDESGERSLWTFAGPEAKAWDIEGFLYHGLEIQRAETTALMVARLLTGEGDDD